MIFVKLIDLPVTVKALVHRNDDDSYTIILNSRLCREQNVRSYLHELQHNMIYALIEDGAADEYDIQRLRGVQSQLHVIDAKIKEVTAKRDVSVVTEKDVCKFIKERYIPFIQKYSAENNFRAIIEELIDRIEVDVNNVTIHYKLACEWCDWGQTFHALTFTDIFSRDMVA